MKNPFVVIILISFACIVFVNCNTNQNKKIKSGYVKEVDTLIDTNTHTITAINRTFYRKLPTLHNNLLEFMQPEGETYVVVVVKTANTNSFSLFVIEDFKQFLNSVQAVKNDVNTDFTLSIDDTKSTYMRKSLTFESGVFIGKEKNATPPIMFDLSEKDLNDIEKAYYLYLNE